MFMLNNKSFGSNTLRTTNQQKENYKHINAMYVQMNLKYNAVLKADYSDKS